MPPSGLPEVFLESGEEPLRSLVARFARSRGPFTTGEANERFGRDVEPELRALEREEQLVRGELRPGGTEREWCDPDVLRRLRRASLAALRKEVEPVEQATLGRFLPSWHGDRPARDAPRGARPAPGAVAAGLALGDRRAAAARAGLPAGAARPALRHRRGRVGRRRARPRRALLPRGRGGARAAGRPRRARGRSARPRFARRWRRAPSSGSTCSPRPASRRRRRCRRSGISSGRAR